MKEEEEHWEGGGDDDDDDHKKKIFWRVNLCCIFLGNVSCDLPHFLS